ncbi:FCD domain-containing protein [Microbacterium excoecariae]|uniref:FCD domain-containing protein n=1 Tax=Microbacterium excoecariae TaxID=2715210 RepID=UPI00140B5130|nr:FadR family transcriptional regulator [Microbacterium excoecariae]
MTARFVGVLDEVGAAICAGALAPGDAVTAQEIERSSGASRSVVREAMRVLETLGLVRPVRRVGLVVAPRAAWNTLDARVIRWTLASPARAEQVRQLREMRIAIEPEAARLAAGATPAHAGAIVAAAGELWAARDGDDFGERDAAFHRLVLEASGNALFVRLADVIDEALRDRWHVDMADRAVDHADAQLHLDLAAHIQRGEADAAWSAAREIVTRTADDSER